MTVSAQQLANAAFLAQAAYATDYNGQARAALQALSAPDAPAAWQLVDLAFFENHGVATLTAQDFVSGYFDNGIGSAQALVAYREYDGHKELAISFRGTAEFPVDHFVDFINGVGIVDWASIYNNFASLISAFLDLANALNTDRILVTGHSLGGAMAEMLMAEIGAVYNPTCVTFGSPGVREIGNPSLAGQFLNIQHGGDPVPDATVNDIEQGVDVRIDRPDVGNIPSVPALAVVAVGGYVGEHARKLYVDTARELAANSAFFSEFAAAPNSFSVQVDGDAGSRLFHEFDSGRQFVAGGGGVDIITGSFNADLLLGGAGNDDIDGSEGADKIDAGIDNDTIRGGPGDDIIYGGDGDDTVKFDYASGFYKPPEVFGNKVVVSAKSGPLSVDGTDTLYDVEYLQFSDTTIKVADLRATQDLSAGTAPGGNASDGGVTPSGGGASGNDGNTAATQPVGKTIVGNDTSEYLSGTSGPDVFRGNGGDDVLTGFAGQDSFDGGPGSDTVDYSYQPADVIGIVVNLGSDTAVFPGFYTETLT